MHAKRLLWSIRVPSLVVIAQAVFLLERDKQTDRQTNRQADASERNTHAAAMPAWVTTCAIINIYRQTSHRRIQSTIVYSVQRHSSHHNAPYYNNTIRYGKSTCAKKLTVGPA